MNVAWGTKPLEDRHYVMMDVRPVGQVQADVMRIPVRDGSVERMELHHVLEHLYRDDAPVALREIYRVLRPGGILDIAVPDLVEC